MSNLRIGVPSKGRLSDLAGELLKQAGLPFRRQERSLFARVGDMPIDITFLRTDDIPVLCAEGAIDMGITGSDLMTECGADVETRLDLGVGKCKLAHESRCTHVIFRSDHFHKQIFRDRLFCLEVAGEEIQ